MLGMSAESEPTYKLICDVAGRLSFGDYVRRVTMRALIATKNRFMKFETQAGMAAGLVDRAWEEIENGS